MSEKPGPLLDAGTENEKTMKFEINKDLDLQKTRSVFFQNSRVQILDFINEEQARLLAEHIQKDVDFKQAFFANGASREVTTEEFRALNQSQKSDLLRQIYSQATGGIGFWYGRHHLNPGSPAPIKALYDWLNCEQMLNTIRTITGISELKSVTAQVSRFLPGDFLTRHQDDAGPEQRRVAFVLNLSPDWHPDWGGLLQFFKLDGTTLDAWTPKFNTLNLFDVKEVHSVTCVAPFAPKPRIAISGWFKTLQAHGNF